jgi:ferrous iron transport protein A
MPLIMARVGQINYIKKVSANSKTRQFLENLGFVPGACIEVISKLNGNMIINIKQSRIAISDDMAIGIIV